MSKDRANPGQQPLKLVKVRLKEQSIVDPGTSARSRHNVLACRRGAPAAEQPRINGVALWPVGNQVLPGRPLAPPREHICKE